MAFNNKCKKSLIICIISLLVCCIGHCSDTDPWGQDSELANEKLSAKEFSPFLAGFDSIIFFHQKVISEADGPRSHFVPSSSQYMLEAIRKYGFLTGFSYGCDRLIRENNDPWIYPVIRTRGQDLMKSDPVP